MNVACYNAAMNDNHVKFEDKHPTLWLIGILVLLIICLTPLYFYMQTHGGFDQKQACPDVVMKYTNNPTQTDCKEGSGSFYNN